jgi:enoyl-CoA hydratase/carnithine racemase
VSSSSASNLITIEEDGDIAIVRLDRPTKRNALHVAIVTALGKFFRDPPAAVRAVVLAGNGDHFSAGLDLSELEEGTAFDAVLHSRHWHEEFRHIEFGRVPVVAALHGAVVGGGLELATSCHIRVADESAYFGLPEGQRGIFVGGGGSVRIARIMGAHRMADLMLTGRVFDAKEGEACGIVNYLVPQGQHVEKAIALAKRIAKNAPISNYSVMQALPRIAAAPAETGFFLESVISAIASDSPEAKARLRAFLEGRAAKVVKETKQ